MAWAARRIQVIKTVNTHEEEKAMNPIVIRIVAGVLGVIVLGIIVARRKKA